MSIHMILAAAALAASPDAAQVIDTPQAVVSVAQPQVAEGVGILRAGTEIPLITREELTTKKKKLRIGQRVQLEVSGNVIANGVVVIPAGAPAIAELTEVRNKGMWGKSGYIAARIISVRVGDRHVRLSGSFDDKGVTGTGGVVAAVALLPIAGFFTTGTSATIPMGSGTKAFLDEDVSYRYTPQVVATTAVVAAPEAVAAVAVPASQ